MPLELSTECSTPRSTLASALRFRSYAARGYDPPEVCSEPDAISRAGRLRSLGVLPPARQASSEALKWLRLASQFRLRNGGKPDASGYGNEVYRIWMGGLGTWLDWRTPSNQIIGHHWSACFFSAVCSFGAIRQMMVMIMLMLIIMIMIRITIAILIIML